MDVHVSHEESNETILPHTDQVLLNTSLDQMSDDGYEVCLNTAREQFGLETDDIVVHHENIRSAGGCHDACFKNENEVEDDANNYCTNGSAEGDGEMRLHGDYNTLDHTTRASLQPSSIYKRLDLVIANAVSGNIDT